MPGGFRSLPRHPAEELCNRDASADHREMQRKTASRAPAPISAGLQMTQHSPDSAVQQNDPAPYHVDMNSECTHLDQIRDVTASANGCEDCLRIGDTWHHLRLCLTCGHVGCCDSSKNKHATEHFHETTHPIIRSFQPGEDWGWCYVDEVMLDEV